MTMQAELPYSPALNDAASWFTGVREPVLAGTAFLMLALLAPTTFAYLVDARTVGDISVWTKPLKFQISLAVYLATLAFFARYMPRETLLKPWYRVYALAVAGAVILEMIWLMSAAAIGTSSHFNPTPLGQTIYRTMGALAVLLTSMSAVQAWQIARNDLTGLSPTMKHGLVAGLALVLPLTLLTAGAMSTMGSHAVGIDPAGAERLAGIYGWRISSRPTPCTSFRPPRLSSRSPEHVPGWCSSIWLRASMPPSPSSPSCRRWQASLFLQQSARELCVNQPLTKSMQF
jgi:hypothetical protein